MGALVKEIRRTVLTAPTEPDRRALRQGAQPFELDGQRGLSAGDRGLEPRREIHENLLRPGVVRQAGGGLVKARGGYGKRGGVRQQVVRGTEHTRAGASPEWGGVLGVSSRSVPYSGDPLGYGRYTTYAPLAIWGPHMTTCATVPVSNP